MNKLLVIALFLVYHHADAMERTQVLQEGTLKIIETLHQAVQDGNIGLVGNLLELTIPCDAPNEKKQTILHVAAQKGNEPMTRLILDRGASKESIDADLNTPLHYAVSSGHVGTTRLLTEKKGGLLNVFETCKAISMKNKLGATPLDQALAAKNKDLVKILVDAGENAGSDTLSKASREGNRDAVALLIGAGVAVDSHDREEYKTPLHLAAAGNHTETVRSLIGQKAGLDSQDKAGHTPLYLAATAGALESAQVLIQSGANWRTVVLKAMQEGKVDALKILLGAGIDAKNVDGKGNTLLQVAIEHNLTGKQEVTKFAIQNSDLNAQNNKQKETALHSALVKGDETLVENVLAAGALPRAYTATMDTPLHYAARYGREKSARLLLEHMKKQGLFGLPCNAELKYPIDVAKNEAMAQCIRSIESRRLSDDATLAIAAQEGHLGLIKLLLGRNQFSATDSQGNKMSEILAAKALNYGHEDVAEFFLENNADLCTGEKGKHLLEKSITKGWIQVLRFLLKKGILDSLSDQEVIQLYVTTWAGPLQTIFNNMGSMISTITQQERNAYSSTLSLLIEYDEKLSERGGQGPIPKVADILFFMGSVACNRPTLEKLVSKGARMDSLGAAPRGMNPLSLAAASNQSPDVVLYLLNLNKQWHKEGELLPLELAVIYGHIELAKLLLENCSRYEGRLMRIEGSLHAASLAHIAAAGGTKNFDALLKELTDLAIRVQIQQQKGAQEPYFPTVKEIQKCSIDQKFLSLLELLIKRGSSTELALPGFSFRPLHIAALFGNHAAAKILIDAKAEKDSLSAGDTTPLSLACGGGHEATARLLVKSGALVSKQAANKETPLHSAVVGGKSSLAQFLLDHRADVNAQTVHGNTPLHYAALLGDEQTVKVLLAGGADPRKTNTARQTPGQLAKLKQHFGIARSLGEAVSMSDLTNVFIRHHTKAITAMHLAVEQNLLISCSFDGTIKIWDASTLECVRTIDLEGFVAHSVCYDSIHDRIIATIGGGQINAWERKTGAPASITFERGAQHVYYDPILNHIITENGILDALSGKHIQGLEDAERFTVQQMCYEPTSQKIVAGSPSGIIKVWDAQDGKCLKTTTDTNTSNALCFDPSNNRIITASNTLRALDAQTGKCTHSAAKVAPGAQLLAFDAVHHKIISGFSHEVFVWELDQGIIQPLKKHTAKVTALCPDPAHRRLIIGYEDGSFYICKEGYLADPAEGCIVQ